MAADARPKTRIVVFDVERRERIAASPARTGFATPLRFESGVLVYRHTHHDAGERELRLGLEPGG